MTHKRKLRGIAILITLAFLLSLLPAGMASAATNMWCPKPEMVTDGTQPALGPLFIDVDPGVLSGTETLEIKLPTDVDFIDNGSNGYSRDDDFAIGDSNDPSMNVMIVAPASVGGDGNAITDPANQLDATMSTNKITITLDASATVFATDYTFLRIYFNKVDVASGFEGDIKAVVSSPTHFPSGSVLLATCGAGEATIAIDDVETVTESGDAIAQITIEENVGGAIKAEEDTIELTLPRGFTWQIVDIGKAWGFADYEVVANAVYTEDNDVEKIGWTLSSDEDTLKLHLGKKSGSKGRITIDARLKIDESKAEPGDVVLEVSGGTSVKPDSLVVAKYAEYGAVVKEGTVAEVLAGREDAKIGEFYIEENAAGSIYGGRSINLTLPDWAKWPASPSKVKISVEKGNIRLGARSYVDSDRHILKIKIDEASTSASKIKFKKDTEIELAPNASGDLVIEVGGTAGVSGSVKVATVKAPVTASVDSVANVKIGVSEQAIGDLTITEARAKALMEKDTDNDGKLKIEAPPGVTFAAVPKVEVTEGNVDIGTVTREAKDDESNRVVVIPIKSQSTKASTLKVSGIKLTIDRTVPEGDVVFAIKGNAVERTSDNDEWKNITAVAKVVAAKVLTPAPGETKVTAVLQIGSTTMKVNGVDVSMDVAPYLKNNRTYVSARFCANALGIDDNNIMWDGATKTATIIAGAKVIQLKVGSNVMVINGANITMDTAPELVPPGRVMLPIGWLAWALGAKADWDGATQTATLEL